jgi:hypothetical protein
MGPRPSRPLRAKVYVARRVDSSQKQEAAIDLDRLRLSCFATESTESTERYCRSLKTALSDESVGKYRHRT